MHQDYIKNKNASQEMAENIQNWYHTRGYSKVKIWVEESKVVSPHGTKLPSNYFIRGNVTFDVANIKDGMLE